MATNTFQGVTTLGDALKQDSVNSLLSGLAREGPSWIKWSLFPLVGQLREQSSAWQDIDGLVCSAGFDRECLPR